MKQTWKKLTGVFLMAVFALTVLVNLQVTVNAAGQTAGAGTVEDQLISASVGTTTQIVEMSETDIQMLLDSQDKFSVMAMTAWTASNEGLGAVIEVGEGEAVMEKKNIIVTVPVTFENKTADFVYTYDETYAPTNLSVDVRQSMAEKLEKAGMNTVMGIGIVFAMLLFLSFIISLFRFIPGAGTSKKTAKETPAAAAAPAPEAVQAIEEECVDDAELTAVIAAAIAASENTSADGFTVRSIRKVSKRNWQRA